MSYVIFIGLATVFMIFRKSIVDFLVKVIKRNSKKDLKDSTQINSLEFVPSKTERTYRFHIELEQDTEGKAKISIIKG